MLLRAALWQMGRFPLWMGLLCVTFVFQTHESAIGQDAAEKKPVVAATEAKKRAEPKGRLPAYYGELVTMEQREKIYSIQGKFTAQLKKIQDELDAITDQRDKEVEAVLTPEQKEKLTKLQNDAKAKRAAAAKKRADDLKSAAKPATGDATK